MSVTLSPPVRIAAFVGILASTALAAFLFLLGRGSADEGARAAEAPARVAENARQPAKPEATTARPVATRPAARPSRAAGPRTASGPTRSGFPPVVDRALRRHGVVVVAVTLPGSPLDAFVRAEARTGALLAGAGFVSVTATSERVVRPLVAKTGVLPEPAILVVRRPGVLVATLGVTDRAVVAQAVAHARR